MVKSLGSDVIGKLRESVTRINQSQIYKEIVEPRDAVFARFQPLFSDDHIPALKEEEFRDFLLFENNHHWTGLHRQGPRICKNMIKLRESLAILVNEGQSLVERLNKAIEMVSGMGKNIATAILIILYPDRYGVWNNRSEANMKQLGIWPAFDRGESFGKRYAKVNEILLQLRDALQIDLWTLDALWWFLDQEIISNPPEIGLIQEVSQSRFGLERHLHEFLRDNWNHTEIGQEWEIYREDGDDEAGYEYPCDVGRIDLLAKHKTDPRWLVIELKRDQTSDQTLGQLLRYIGWVKLHLAEENDEVYGLIVCHEAEATLEYALSVMPNVELRLYEVEFHLKKPKSVTRGKK
ncbi:MAG TPA: endonuclease NucS [bacterium]|nr:endonuclease NucS [bacterium]